MTDELNDTTGNMNEKEDEEEDGKQDHEQHTETGCPSQNQQEIRTWIKEAKWQ